MGSERYAIRLCIQFKHRPRGANKPATNKNCQTTRQMIFRFLFLFIFSSFFFIILSLSLFLPHFIQLQICIFSSHTEHIRWASVSELFILNLFDDHQLNNAYYAVCTQCEYNRVRHTHTPCNYLFEWIAVFFIFFINLQDQNLVKNWPSHIDLRWMNNTHVFAHVWVAFILWIIFDFHMRPPPVGVYGSTV